MSKQLLSLTLLFSLATIIVTPLHAADPGREVRGQITMTQHQLSKIRQQIAILEKELQEFHEYAETGHPQSIGLVDNILDRLQRLRTREQAMQQRLDQLRTQQQ